MKPLTIPPAAQADEQSIQMLSAWIAKQGLHCAINVGMWDAQGRDEPAAWGMLLAEVVRQVAKAAREQGGAKPDQTIDAIVDSLLNELNDPGSPAPGSFDAQGA